MAQITEAGHMSGETGTNGANAGNGNRPNGEPPINAAEISGRDLQRHALRDLVELSEQCATDEQAVERRHDEGLAAERQDVEHKTYAAEKRAKGVEEEIRAKYQERLGKIQAQFQAETASIREAHEKGKRKVQNEFGPVELDIKKKYNEAVEVADAELEFAQAQILAETRKSHEDLKEHGLEMDDLEGRAIALLKVFRHNPGDQDPSVLATRECEKHLP
jgi:hypothetical protein